MGIRGLGIGDQGLVAVPMRLCFLSVTRCQAEIFFWNRLWYFN